MDQGCAGTCLSVMLEAVWRLQIPACCRLEFWQLVWTDEWRLLMWNQTNQSSGTAGESSFPCSQMEFCWISCLLWPLLALVFNEMAPPLSPAQRIMGKVCQVSDVSPLWLTLFYHIKVSYSSKEAGEITVKVVHYVDIDMDHVTCFCIKLVMQQTHSLRKCINRLSRQIVFSFVLLVIEEPQFLIRSKLSE